jgi:alpha-tubulin suppressor-like RCC1 family protein
MNDIIFSVLSGKNVYGTLWSWGSTSYGVLGGRSGSNTSPGQIGSDSWIMVSAGDRHSLAIKNDDTLWAWGSNAYGQIGDDTINWFDETPPIQIGNDTWTMVSAGKEHSLGLKTNGTLWAWGSGGRLGDGTNNGQTSPIQIGSDTWLMVSAGRDHSLGLKTDGTLWSWGSNNFGQLGDGTNGSGTNKNSPVQIGSDTWTMVSGGWSHSLALRTDGTLWSWGRNNFGQLGDGSNDNRNSPVQVGSDTWIMVSAGGYHSLGLKTDGTLWSWGYNYGGQLGDGTNGSGTNKNSPVQVGSDTWTMVSGGGEHSLGLKTNGTLWSWGINFSGHLGDGSNDNRNSPGQIGSDSWLMVTGGFAHSLALKTVA